MSACQCCEIHNQIDPIDEIPSENIEEQRRLSVAPLGAGNLFNWVTAILLTGWITIVAVALEFAGPEGMAPVPTLEAFLRQLL